MPSAYIIRAINTILKKRPRIRHSEDIKSALVVDVFAFTMIELSGARRKYQIPLA